MANYTKYKKIGPCSCGGFGKWIDGARVYDHYDVIDINGFMLAVHIPATTQDKDVEAVLDSEVGNLNIAKPVKTKAP